MKLHGNARTCPHSRMLMVRWVSDRRFASKNMTTRTIQSSRSPNNESKNSLAAATPSTNEPAN